MSINLKSSGSAHSTAGKFPGVRSTGGILDRIVEVKARTLVNRLDRDRSYDSRATVSEIQPGGKPGDLFEEALSRPGKINIIAEVKRKSPSKGTLREDFDPISIAKSYSLGGAAAISVLTEEEFFGGSIDYLRQIRRRVTASPLLRKDFIISVSQAAESRVAGASALLLIVAILEDALLAELMAAARENGLASLVEVHDENELERAARAGARIIGVNNRDLKDFSVSLDTSLRLAKLAPQEAVLVSESGISTAADIARLAEAGFKAFLVGEQFMKAEDPGSELANLIVAAEALLFPESGTRSAGG